MARNMSSRAALVVPPAAVRLEVHVRELPDLARVVDPALQAPRLLLRAHLEPVLDQDWMPDSTIVLLDQGRPRRGTAAPPPRCRIP